VIPLDTYLSLEKIKIFTEKLRMRLAKCGENFSHSDYLTT